MSEKERQKKNGRDKNKKNQAMRESVTERKQNPRSAQQTKGGTDKSRANNPKA